MWGHFENDSAIPLISNDRAFWKRLGFDFKNDSIPMFFALRTTRFDKPFKSWQDFAQFFPRTGRFERPARRSSSASDQVVVLPKQEAG